MSTGESFITNASCLGCERPSRDAISGNKSNYFEDCFYNDTLKIVSSYLHYSAFLAQRTIHTLINLPPSESFGFEFVYVIYTRRGFNFL